MKSTYKTALVATLVCASLTQAWASKSGDEVGEDQQVNRSYGFNPTSDKDIEKIKERINLAKMKASKAQMFVKFLHHENNILPPSYDISSYCKILDQGRLGSCTANALAGQVYALQAIELQEKNNESLETVKSKLKNISRLFVYYQEREREHTVDRDAGASLGDGILSLYTLGAPYEENWTYSDETNTPDPHVLPKFKQHPSPKAYRMAFENKDLDDIHHDLIESHGGAYNLNEIKMALHANQPIVFGMNVYPSFESPQVARTGMVPMPQPNERILGGHAVLMVGYDDATRHFKVANSWSERWGDNGFFHLPYEFVTPTHVREIWKTGKVTLTNDALNG